MRAVILDTGVANLSSLAFAVKRLGVEPIITREAAEIRAADRIFLPGVGTARAAMAAIEERGLADLIREATQPVLGICLGEQILGRRSEETDGVDLLGLIDADVRALRADGLPLPHMGWNRVYPEDTPHARLLFRGIEAGDWFYFVHSYAMPTGACTTARCTYGEEFTAAAAHENFMGVQFHPERSGRAGARLIANFLGIEALSSPPSTSSTAASCGCTRATTAPSEATATIPSSAFRPTRPQGRSSCTSWI